MLITFGFSLLALLHLSTAVPWDGPTSTPTQVLTFSSMLWVPKPTPPPNVFIDSNARTCGTVEVMKNAWGKHLQSYDHGYLKDAKSKKDRSTVISAKPALSTTISMPWAVV
jgi:hypothetical protein